MPFPASPAFLNAKARVEGGDFSLEALSALTVAHGEALVEASDALDHSAYSPVTSKTQITVLLGVQSVEMAWSKLAASFSHSPYMADQIRADLERTGTARHEEFAFFHPQHRLSPKESV